MNYKLLLAVICLANIIYGIFLGNLRDNDPDEYCKKFALVNPNNIPIECMNSYIPDLPY